MNQRNDPAERLHSDLWDGQDPPVYDSERALPIIDQALAAERALERAATVERIRDRLGQPHADTHTWDSGPYCQECCGPWVDAILDEEASGLKQAAMRHTSNDAVAE